MQLTALWWWIDRWRKSTAYTDMTLEEQGAYRNLLDEGTLRGGPIPNDERILGKACGDALRWKVIRKNVLARFELRPDGWHNATLDEVISESQRRAKKQKNYRNRHGNDGGNEGGNTSGNNGSTPPVTTDDLLGPDPSPDQEPTYEDQNLPPQNARRDSRPVENLASDAKPVRSTVESDNGQEAHRVQATLRVDEDGPSTGASDRRRGMEGARQGHDGEVGLRGAGPGDVGPGDDGGRTGTEANDRTAPDSDRSAPGNGTAGAEAGAAHLVRPNESASGMEHRRGAHGEAQGLNRLREIVSAAAGRTS